MSRSWQFHIQDILDAISKVERYLTGYSYDQFVAEEMRVDAVIRNLEIIGEAAAQIPPDIQARYATIPWPDIKNMRNILAHVYFGVNLKIVWETFTNDLPPLKKVLQQILDEANQTP